MTRPDEHFRSVNSCSVVFIPILTEETFVFF